MEILAKTYNLFLNFIFPKNPKALSLSTLGSGGLMKLFPSSPSIEEADLISIFDYRNNHVRDFIWEIKYRADKELIKRAAEIIYDVLCHEVAERGLFENFKNPLLVPIPMSKERSRDKGFNQTELLGEALFKLDKENIFEYAPKVLEKIRYTDTQTKTESKSSRLANLKNSMAAHDEVSGRCIILIDDVFTTGATIAEAKRALKKAGAKKIIALTIAH